jgi:tryptophan synthase alpha chain
MPDTRLGEGLAARLLGLRDAGRKAFVPYVTAGLPGVDAAFLRGLAGAGADAVEVGIPFSDPMMDGPVIQEASKRALEAGTTPAAAFDLIRRAALDVPVAVMTYLNPVLAMGMEAFAGAASAAGVAGAILPDLPVDEADGWMACAKAAGLAPVFLAAPNSTPERLAAIAAAGEGFVYCVATFGVTGAREELAASARRVVAALRPLTETPLLVGIGISTPEQARAACGFADGVVVGTALVEPLLRGAPAEAIDRARRFRDAIA